MKKVGVAIVGVGAISGIYLDNITKVFRELELVGVCDMMTERAESAAKTYGCRVYASLEDVLADDNVEMVLNLTRPYEHYTVSKAALLAGKHVYTEKPLGATFEEGFELEALAKSRGLLLGGAPDTFLGAGIQTCRKLIDDDFIGDVIGASASMICRGHESWHPNPEFYYQNGGGPMLDMGPYYVTALINLMGGVRGVTGVQKASFPQRVITAGGPKFGNIVEVEAPTFIMGIMDFESGATASIFTTFDVYYPHQSGLEVYGTKGTLFVPDPNSFGGPVILFRGEDNVKREMPLLFDYADNSRGLGLADMGRAIRSGRVARADGQQTLHVLEILTAFEQSHNIQGYYPLKTKFTRNPAMKNNPTRGILD